MKRRIRRALKAASTVGIIGAMSWQVHETSGELRAEREAEVLRAEAAQESLDKMTDIALEISNQIIATQVQYVDEYNDIPSGCIPSVMGMEEGVEDIVGCDLNDAQVERVRNRLTTLQSEAENLELFFDDTSFGSLGYYEYEAIRVISDVSMNSVFTDLFDTGSYVFVIDFDSDTGQLVYGRETPSIEADFMKPYVVFALGTLSLYSMIPRRKRKPKSTNDGDDTESETVDSVLLADGVGND